MLFISFNTHNLLLSLSKPSFVISIIQIKMKHSGKTKIPLYYVIENWPIYQIFKNFFFGSKNLLCQCPDGALLVSPTLERFSESMRVRIIL